MYARRTKVTEDRSKTELKRVIYNHGGANYQFGETDEKAMIQFKKENRLLRFIVFFPGLQTFSKTPKGRARAKQAVWLEYEAEHRRRWRALILAIKAKFEIVESEIAEFEQEFMPYIVMPNGKTVAEVAMPMIEHAYATGKMPKSILMIEAVKGAEDDD